MRLNVLAVNYYNITNDGNINSLHMESSREKWYNHNASSAAVMTPYLTGLQLYI